jgi:hypothetical protein
MTAIYSVPVVFISGKKSIFLRELTTQDELSIVDSSTIGAIQLINNLSEHPMNNIEYPFRAETLVSADRDSLLAAIYKKTYSDLLQSTIHCASCNVPFDLDFSLSALINHIQQSNNQDIVFEVKEQSQYELPDGTSFRLPTGEDELSVEGLSAQSSIVFLLERCVQIGDINFVGQQVQEAMAQIAPVLATEILAHCPECGQEQEVYFDMQSFLLSRLIQEKKQILWEVHRLASVYHWTHSEIINLPRSLRKNYVSLIDTEL